MPMASSSTVAWLPPCACPGTEIRNESNKMNEILDEMKKSRRSLNVSIFFFFPFFFFFFFPFFFFFFIFFQRTRGAFAFSPEHGLAVKLLDCGLWGAVNKVPCKQDSKGPRVNEDSRLQPAAPTGRRAAPWSLGHLRAGVKTVSWPGDTP